MIDTTLGKMDEASLDCSTFIVDDPLFYGREYHYRVRGEGHLIAKYQEVLWRKENEFLVDPPTGKVTTTRGEMSLDQLVKRTGTNDNAREFSCWVEYLPIGEDEVIHRSAHTKLKFTPVSATGTPGNF